MKMALLCASVLLLAHQSSAQVLKSKTSCVASQENYIVRTGLDKDAKEKEVENWEVNCTVTLGDEVIWGGPGKGKLVLAHPSTFREAIEAITVFRKERAPELVKQYLKEHSPA